MKAIICGTKKDSIGRYIGESLVFEGWNIWLYSRDAKESDTGNLHERRADLTHEEEIERLITESQDPDLVIMSADTGSVFGLFEQLAHKEIRAFLDAKLFGSITFIQSLLRHKKHTKIVFLGGKIGPKSKDFLLYGIVNPAIMALVEEINRHYGPQLEAYYLETPVIYPSPVAQQYAHVTGQSVEGQHPSVVMGSVRNIFNNEHTPGLVPCVEGNVL